MNRRLAGVALLGAAVLVLSGCAASTAINAQWVNPQAGNRLPVKSVMVMDINRDSTARRIYEDAMVAELPRAASRLFNRTNRCRAMARRTAGDSGGSVALAPMRC